MTGYARVWILVGALVLTGCMEPPAPQMVEPPDTRAADAEAIHSLVAGWSAAAQARDVEKFLSVYEKDAVLMIEDMPDYRGLDAIREGITGMMSDPLFDLSFSADNVVVARSGDMAYETGTYSMTMSGEDGQPAVEKGSYLVVWRKQADGSWKVVADVPVSDPPEEAAAPAGV